MPAPGLPAVRDGVRRLASAAIGLVYPPTCVACGGATGQPHALCAACWRGLRLIERPYCERLGTPKTYKIKKMNKKKKKNSM